MFNYLHRHFSPLILLFLRFSLSVWLPFRAQSVYSLTEPYVLLSVWISTLSSQSQHTFFFSVLSFLISSLQHASPFFFSFFWFFSTFFVAGMTWIKSFHFMYFTLFPARLSCSFTSLSCSLIFPFHFLAPPRTFFSVSLISPLLYLLLIILPLTESLLRLLCSSTPVHPLLPFPFLPFTESSSLYWIFFPLLSLLPFTESSLRLLRSSTPVQTFLPFPFPHRIIFFASLDLLSLLSLFWPFLLLIGSFSPRPHFLPPSNTLLRTPVHAFPLSRSSLRLVFSCQQLMLPPISFLLNILFSLPLLPPPTSSAPSAQFSSP